MKKILHYGWFMGDNIGDSQYSQSFPLLFPHDQHRFVSSLQPSDISWSDEVIIGGGNIITNSFLKSACEAVAGKKPMKLHSVGCSDRNVSKDLLKKFKQIWVRDARSQSILSGLSIASTLVPDASWVLESSEARGRALWASSFAQRGLELYDRRVAVVLNSHLTSSPKGMLERDMARWQAFANDMVEIIDGTYCSYGFLAFGRKLPWDDRVPGGWVAHKCKWVGKNLMVWDMWGVQDTLDFLAGADLVISMRLHSSLFSCIANVPFIDITHHDKNLGFLESVGLNDWSVPYWDFSRKALRDLMDHHWEDHDRQRTRLREITKARKTELLNYVKKL